MIAHVSIGARDIARARRFYDATLKPLGYTCLHPAEGSLGYGAKNADFWIIGTEHPVPADDQSGLHICFVAPDRASVDAFHKAALKNGGKDNGEPGLRADYGPNYYAAFAVDPDGYRIEAWCGNKS
jgi:catechol 2,3-dioxygenase-like lactoylglutathione lyase family enzyme